MIFLVHTKWNSRPGLSFLATPPGQTLAHRLAAASYQKLARRSRALPRALYLLGDLEVLKGDQELVESVCDRLRETVGPDLVLNQPGITLGRYDLLRRLAENGINDFNIYRLEDGELPRRFPIFIREERDHAGSRTELIKDSGTLEAKLEELRQTPEGLRYQVATEFMDTGGADGVYRKYGAFCLGGEIIPRHLLQGHHWMLKEPEITTPNAVEEERAYLEGNPHREQLERICALAGVGYGRVDYGVRDGRVQVWEINTNPVIMRPVHFRNGPRLGNQLWFADQLQAALDRLDPGGNLPLSLRWEAVARQQRFALGRFRQRFVPAVS